MANSKSNIYPIQLQGAELNLNKLDAEIKQYSGFNKNNAPFVGGCLSNVFVKESDTEGETPDNTIIDSNGDIYHVDTEGFYKNGEKVIAYDNHPFIECEKFKFDADVLKAYSDKVFLRKKADGYYLNDIFLGGIPYTFTDESFTSRYSCGVWESNTIFTFTCFTRKGDYAASATLQLRIVVLNIVNDEIRVIGNYTDDEREYYTSIGELAVIQTGVIFTKELNGRTDSIYLYKLSNKTSVQSFSVAYQEFVSGDAFAYYTLYSYASMIVQSSYNVTLGANNKFRVKFYSLPINAIVWEVIDVTHDTLPAMLPSFLVAAQINYNITEQKFNIYDSNVLRIVPLPTSYGSFSNPDMKSLKSDIPDNSVIRFNFGYLGTGDGTHLFFGLTDAFVQTKEDFFSTTGGAIFTLRVRTTTAPLNCYFDVLINFNNVSGIIANKDGNKILVSEWNNVKPNSITFLPSGIIYSDYNDNWFIIKTTNTPKIKLVYNQIVSNVLFDKNSWFIKEGKSGYYAPGFNCSRYTPFDTLTTEGMTYFKDHYEERYVAYGINEYNLKDNASILLNPFSCFVRIRDGERVVSPEEVNLVNVNAYIAAADETTPKYELSYYSEINRPLPVTNSELLGLPYPTDTNGNVSYCPNLFSEIENTFGNQIMIKNNNILYFLQKENNVAVMSFYLAGGVENVAKGFIVQGIFYAIMNNGIYSVIYNNGITEVNTFIVDITGLQFVGNTPYEALFFSKTNRCLYSFTGANLLTLKQFVDKVSEIKDYLYNPATQTVFLVTDIGIIFYGLFGQFILDYTNILKITLLDNGIVITAQNDKYYYVKYYLDENDVGYKKQNIQLETCFYGMNNQTVTINDCLYMRIFSEEHEEGDLEVSATTLSLEGRMTEKTTFKIKASDWDKITHTIYLRYQPKEQRGLGISFSINSPFKIASLSVGSQADAILVDKVSKGAINAPQRTSNNVEW